MELQEQKLPCPLRKLSSRWGEEHKVRGQEKARVQSKKRAEDRHTTSGSGGPLRKVMLELGSQLTPAKRRVNHGKILRLQGGKSCSPLT